MTKIKLTDTNNNNMLIDVYIISNSTKIKSPIKIPTLGTRDKYVDGKEHYSDFCIRPCNTKDFIKLSEYIGSESQKLFFTIEFNNEIYETIMSKINYDKDIITFVVNNIK